MFTYSKDLIRIFLACFNLASLFTVCFLCLTTKVFSSDLDFYDQSEMTLINYYSSPSHFQEAQQKEPNPLMLATDRSYDRLVRVLISLGTDVNICNRDGISPLLWAVNKNDNHITQILLDYDANPNLADNKGWTPLMLATQNNNLYLTRLLVEAGANVNATNFEGSSPFLWASRSASVALVSYLFDEGANLYQCNLKKQTAAHIAAQFGKEEILNFLLLKDPSFAQAMDNEGKTPLLKAVETSRYNIVDILAPYEFKTNPDSPLSQAILLAKMQGDKQMVDYLEAFFPNREEDKTVEVKPSITNEKEKEGIVFESLDEIPEGVRSRILTFLGILDPDGIYSINVKKIACPEGYLWSGIITYERNSQICSQNFNLKIDHEEEAKDSC